MLGKHAFRSMLVALGRLEAQLLFAHFAFVTVLTSVASVPLTQPAPTATPGTFAPTNVPLLTAAATPAPAYTPTVAPTSTSLPASSPPPTAISTPPTSTIPQPPTIPVPPPELTWVGILAGLATFVFQALNLIQAYRNRGRIEFRTISSKFYYEPWGTYDLESAPPDIQASIKPGDFKRAFRIIEFTVKNHYPTEVTICRFIIDHWMFSDHYVKGMYDADRNYRVFNLQSREPTTLAGLNNVSPKTTIGFRVEILDRASDARWLFNHVRYVMPRHRKYSVDFGVDGIRQHRIISFPPPERISWNDIHHWSDLLEPPKPSPLGEPLPQGIESADRYPKTWYFRFSGRLSQYQNLPLVGLLARLVVHIAWLIWRRFGQSEWR